MKIKQSSLFIVALGISLIVGGALTASAQTSRALGGKVRMTASSTARRMMSPHMASSTALRSTTSSTASSTVQAKRVTTLTGRGNAELDARIKTLSDLLTRVGSMVKVSATEKATLTTEIQTQISNLTNLKMKIDAEASTTVVVASSSLQADTKSITDSYRVYALIVPQIEILAATDRANTILSSMTILAGKLETRIAAAQTAGQNVTALQASLTDLNAKLADATTQSTAAEGAVVNLVPDQGNQTVAQSNATALKTARADLKTATNDIQAAENDAKSIVKAIASRDANTTNTISTSSPTMTTSSTISATTTTH